VVNSIEKGAGELFPRVGFIVTNLRWKSRENGGVKIPPYRTDKNRRQSGIRCGRHGAQPGSITRLLPIFTPSSITTPAPIATPSPLRLGPATARSAEKSSYPDVLPVTRP